MKSATCKAVVLLSGGLDSVYNLYASEKSWPGQVRALLFNYGQRAWESEKKAATDFSQDLNISLEVVDITSLFSEDKSSLTSSLDVPTDEVNIDDLEASRASAEKVWVSNRNGVFLNIGACFAEKWGADFVVPGFNAEEAVTFPDNSEEYIEKMNACLKLSTSNGVQIHCFSQKMQKVEIMEEALKLGVDAQKIWSCYYNGDKICGRCESCQRFLRALKAQN